MTNSGDFSGWEPCFPDGSLPLLFQTLVAEWPMFCRPEKPLENRISHNFVAHLQRVTRGKVPFGFYFREKKTSKENETEEGEVDIVARAGKDPLVFFGFECKRLRVMGKDGSIRSEAGAYVGPEGMQCFLTGQYDGGGTSGGMIGYVMDGEAATARTAVDEAIHAAKETLRTHSPHRLSPADAEFHCKELEKTVHDYDDLRFTIYHLFLKVFT